MPGAMSPPAKRPACSRSKVVGGSGVDDQGIAQTRPGSRRHVAEPVRPHLFGMRQIHLERQRAAVVDDNDVRKHGPDQPVQFR